ncbi:putative GPI anchored glycoprotein [Aspergillus luchuensis]|uniref:GPI anchored protein n=1 Tax=Aspergillus kawachii TaxID=1069201 RepID=A0A146FUP3_ASPKA|nr:uncharacterized protein AKAW2_70628A [Aspergillus luchuensis]BCS03750.1 hypothetical protein AKAW2_70628A [Aspergillus luchuensis]BCS15366.1 hypothetical protein ALUC_70599A [Aspergillus luchuensis]GAA89296.1 hypothetical protein AKAW_07410 [Aspergillus luchuensis IFO 4308]GAT28899.1 hypothetical protein RIB2604_02700840 [Aspergillus luchuensis]
MRLQLTTSLALLATASTVVADDVISVLWPSSASGENYNAKLIGTTGGDLTTLVINCPATASASVTSSPAATAATTSAAVVKRATTASSSDDDDDDDFNDSCNIPDSGETLTVGSSTWAFTSSGNEFSQQATCSFTGTTVASCAFTYNIDTQTSSSSGVTTTQLNKVPITITSTASATGTATGGASTASATGDASGSSSSAASTGAATTTSDSGAFATGASQWVAGGAAMMVALAMA